MNQEVDIFPELASDWDYKHIIYDDEWATRETDELKYFLRRLGTGGFIALYIVLGQRWSDRISGKVKLPMEYDPDKITAFFQIRPEKVLTKSPSLQTLNLRSTVLIRISSLPFLVVQVALRTLEISVEALKYGLGAAYDNFSFNLTRDVRAYRYLARKALKRVGLLPKQVMVSAVCIHLLPFLPLPIHPFPPRRSPSVSLAKHPETIT